MAVVLVVGLLLYWRNPGLYLGFAWWVWFLTPEVRRLVDYQLGWNPTNPIMLAPLLVTALAFFSLLRHAPKLRANYFFPFTLVFSGLFYAYGVGVFRNGVLNASFDLLNWLVPAVLAFYLVVQWRNYPIHRRAVQRTFAWGVLVMGIYGLAQFFYLPAWDQRWMLSVPMNSIGYPEPLEVRVFSTLNSPGPFAVVMMAGLLLLLSGGGLLRWPAGAVGFASFLLSLYRAAWGGWIVGLLFMVARRGSLRPRLLASLLVVGLVALPLLTIGPVADTVNQRLETISNLGEDVSFRERLEFYSEFLPRAAFNVEGEGLGSTGIATKLGDERGNLGKLGVFDSGIMSVPFVLGWPGSLLYTGGLVWLLAYALGGGNPKTDAFAAASKGIAVAVLVQLLFDNTLINVSGMVFWSFLGLALASRVYYGQESRADGGEMPTSNGIERYSNKPTKDLAPS